MLNDSYERLAGRIESQVTRIVTGESQSEVLPVAGGIVALVREAAGAKLVIGDSEINVNGTPNAYRVASLLINEMSK